MTTDPVRDIFNKAVELTGVHRTAFLDEACGDDQSLRGEVESLLAHYATEIDPPDQANCLDSASQLDANVQVGRVIGDYTLLNMLGEGGFGVVYRAQQNEPIRREVALKLIKPGMDSKAVLGRFESERQALALMDHPGVARILDAGLTDDGRPYFVMEFVKGVPLTKFCDTNRLDVRERVELFTNLCAALQHAHGKGVIHRDIKPGNILGAFEDGKPAIKIIDFGIAKAINQRLSDQGPITIEDRLIGTPMYMSPEQVEMSPLDVDVRSDVYSLGVVLYELLAGRPPFESDELFSAGLSGVQKILREKDPPRPSLRFDDLRSSSQDMSAEVAKSRSIDPSLLGKRLRGDLDWIVMKCLEKPRVRRYETADALRSDLMRFLANEPVEARPPGAGYRLQKFAKRHTGFLVSMAAVLLALIAGVIVSLMFAVEASQQRDLAREAQQAAETNYEEVKALAGGLMTVYAEIYKGDNMLQARERLAMVTLKSLETLQGESSDDLQLQASIAGMYKLLGDVAGGIRSANRGSPAEARTLYVKAMTINQRLIDEGYETTKSKLALAASHQSLADLDKRGEDHEEALDRYRKALNIAQPLADGLRESDPLFLRTWRNVASLLRSISTEQEAIGESINAQASFEQALAIFERLYRSNPNPETERDYAVILNIKAYRQAQGGNFEAALASHSEALELRKRADRKSPDNTTRRDLAWSNWFVGDVLVNLHRDSEASKHFTIALTLMAESCNRNPEDARSRKDLVRMTTQLAKSVRKSAFTGPAAMEACRTAIDVEGLGEATRSQLKELVDQLSNP